MFTSSGLAKAICVHSRLCGPVGRGLGGGAKGVLLPPKQAHRQEPIQIYPDQFNANTCTGGLVLYSLEFAQTYNCVICFYRQPRLLFLTNSHEYAKQFGCFMPIVSNTCKPLAPHGSLQYVHDIG